jgi:2'-5' RNA ligase
MAFAISLKAVNDTADRIRALWEEVARFESRPSMSSQDYPPHLTLAIYDNIPPVQLKAVLREAFAGTSALRLAFTRLHFFDDPLVLWADPSLSAELAAAHAMVHTCLDPRLCHPHYRPGAWVPHCTLGTEILTKDREEAIRFAARPIPAFEVVFDVADCVSFPPVAVLGEQPLARPEPSNERSSRA